MANALRAIDVDPKAWWWILEFLPQDGEPRAGQDPLPVTSDLVLILLRHLMTRGSDHRQIQLWSDGHPLFLERRRTELRAFTSWPAPHSADVSGPLTPEALGWEHLTGGEWDDEFDLVTNPVAGDLPDLSVRLASSLTRMLGMTTIKHINFFDEEWRYIGDQ